LEKGKNIFKEKYKKFKGKEFIEMIESKEEADNNLRKTIKKDVGK